LTRDADRPFEPEAFLSRLRLRHLRLVAAVAETGSLRRCAEKLAVTYAAVVKTRAELEDLIGAPVFQGRGPRLQTTPNGAALLASAQRVLAELNALSGDLLSLQSGLTGTVTIGLRTVSMRTPLADAICAFKQNHPGVTIRILEGLLPRLIDDLEKGRCDIVVGRLSAATLPSPLTGVPVAFPTSVVVTSRGHPARTLPQNDWASLARCAWCLPPRESPLRQAFDNHLAIQGIAPPVDVLEVGDAFLIAALMRNGQLLSLLPEQVALEFQAEKRLEILNAAAPQLLDPIGIIWRKTPAPRGAVRACLEVLTTKLSD
jgi:DNA-binding transcriptional LysR family regulator